MSKLALGAGVGALSLPHQLGVLNALESKSESNNKLSSKATSFDFDHAWAKLPKDLSEGFRYGLTHGVAVDSQDRVYIAHTGHAENTFKDCILVFSENGELLDSFGEEFAQHAHGLDIFQEKDGTEVIYLTDLKRGLFKMTLSGEVLWHLDKPQSMKIKKQWWRPSNVAVSEDGVVYLADGYGSHQIFALSSKTGEELFQFGGTGDHEIGKTFHPHGLWIDQRPNSEPYLIIGENYNRNEKHDFHGVLLRYRLDGTYHDTVETAHELISPRHFTSYGDTLAIPDLDGRVTLLDKNFQLVGHIGDIAVPHDDIREMRKNDPATHPNKKFVCPHDAAYDSKGNLYVVEWVEGGRITKLSPS